MDSKIFDQQTMEDFFRGHLDLFPKARELLGLKISPHDPRFVLDKSAALAEYSLTLATDAGEQKLVLRASTDMAEKRKKHFQVLQALWNGDFSDGRNVVARPIGYFPELKLLLYENVPGQSLYDKFQYKPDAEWKNRLDQAIDWLIMFHSKKPLSIPQAAFDWAEERRRFEQLSSALIKRFPAEAEDFKKAIARMIEQEQRWLKPETFHLIHGDFQPHNILFRDHPPQTIVIDFNDAMLYDELYDLSYFTTQVASMLTNLRQDNIPDLVQKLISRYVGARKLERDKTMEEKLKLFRAKTLLHIKAVIAPTDVHEISNYAENKSN